ncbi:MAG: hypothetical protein AB7S44_00765 [Spirochaetales bacterium]
MEEVRHLTGEEKTEIGNIKKARYVEQRIVINSKNEFIHEEQMQFDFDNPKN